MERSPFLENISKRLGRPQPLGPPERTASGVPEHYRDSPFGEENVSRDQWANRFKEELEALGGTCVLCSSLADVRIALTAAIAGSKSNSIVTWDRSEFGDWKVDWLWDERGAISFTSAPSTDSMTTAELKETMRTADIGITTADFAIANTGTIVLRTTPGRNRSVSLLPTLHIALVRESQIVTRMGNALRSFNQWNSETIPSSIHFISGPSRSADIENDLSIGVHGPAALTVILLKGRTE